MKNSLLIFLIAIVQVSASVSIHGQNLKLMAEGNTVREIFKQIENETNYRFFYNEEFRDLSQPLSFEMRDYNISEVLDLMLANTDVTYGIMENNVVVITPQMRVSQEITVTGRVTEAATGEPIPGVNIVVQGTTIGTATNLDGEYKFTNVPRDGILVFSSVGYETIEVAVEDRAEINIVMDEETIAIDELVVVGYGTQRRSHLTAAVDQIEGRTLVDRPLRSLGDGLVGEMAGLNVRTPSGAPEHSPNLNIRGFTGFGARGAPLVLVDGIEMNLNEVNPNDVESISVLKDGAASAIYGSRAPYGVILITTRSGERDEKMTFRYSLNTSYGRPYGIPTHQDNHNFARSVNEAFRNQPGGGRAPFFGELQIQRMEAYAAGDFTNPVFDGIDPEHVPYGVFPVSPSSWGGHLDVFANTNWLGIALLDAVPSQQHNISVDGGGEQTSYYVGLGYNESVGIFVGENYRNRYSALVKLDSQITDWLNFDFNANYIKSDEEGPNFTGQGRAYGTMFNAFARAFPVWATTNPNGSAYRFNTLPNLDGSSGTEGESRNRMLLSGGITVEPIKDLKIRGRYSWRNTSDNYSRTTLQQFQVLPNGSQVPTQRTVGNNSIIKRYGNANYSTIDLHASYSKTLNDMHSLLVLAGFQQEENIWSNMTGQATNLFSQSVATISTASANFQASDVIANFATRGYFGRFSYNFDQKYFVEFNARYDATSRFTEEDRWGFFPSVSAGWNVARENFWPLNDYVSLFKPRGSWSTSGDSQVGLYPFFPTINISTSNWIILGNEYANMASMPGLVSDQLTWAKPTTLNFGFDMEALDNRLSLNWDWYQRTVRDQFGPPLVVPRHIGTSVPQSNNAVSETRGWEVSLGWRDRAFELFNKPLRYNIRFRMNDYIGYVVEYETDGTGTRSGWTPGQVFGVNYVYNSLGIMQDTDDLYSNIVRGGPWFYPGDLAFRDNVGDGDITNGQTGTWYDMGDLVEDGYNYPRREYGITLGLDWNNFDVSMVLTGVGHWKRYATNMYIWGTSGSQWFAPFFQENIDLGYWRPDNTDAFYPRNAYHGKNRNTTNDQYMLDLSHLRIRNLKVGYNLPRTFLQRISMDRLYVYGSIENLGFIYYNSFIKYDPELISASAGQGYPPQQFFSFGVNVDF